MKQLKLFKLKSEYITAVVHNYYKNLSFIHKLVKMGLTMIDFHTNII